MEITHLGTHTSYGIRLWKFGIILLRTTTIDLPWLTLFSEDASRSQMLVACGQGIRSTSYYFVFALNHLFFFVLLGRKFTVKPLLADQAINLQKLVVSRGGLLKGEIQLETLTTTITTAITITANTTTTTRTIQGDS